MMEIGSKIRNARNEAGFTQEKAAEKLGVTRQTISNWENNRSYPDIISVIKMSDLYSVTLDYLLKEDQKMINHLEEATNVVKSNSRKTRSFIIGIYLLAWVILIGLFWFNEGCSGGNDAVGFSIMSFYVLLPVITLVTAFFIGKDRMWGRSKWFMTAFYGIMYMLAEYATFSLANMLLNDYSHFNFPEFDLILAGAAMGAFGIGIGSLVSSITAKKASKKAIAAENDGKG